jgi:LacI family transcriptional regulator
MGDKKTASLKSIAADLGISVSVVSRVLSGKARQYRISEKTEKRVKDEADRLGFAPNQIASSLRTKKTHTIGLIIPDISNSFFSSVARFVAIEARKRGYSIILCDSQGDAQTEIEAIRLLQSRSVDGLIISPVGQIGDLLKGLFDGGLPLVLLDRYFPDVELPYVTSDNVQGALAATEYLIEKGHQRIACIQGRPDSSTSMDRVAGYRAAMEKHGVEIDETQIVGDDFSERNGYVETKLLLQNKRRPTAIFSLGNLPTFGAIRAIAEEGLSIPEDISLLSFDDHYYSAFLAAPLTAVAQPKEEIGLFAVKLLCNQLAGNRGVEGISLATQLNERSSVRVLN